MRMSPLGSTDKPVRLGSLLVLLVVLSTGDAFPANPPSGAAPVALDLGTADLNSSDDIPAFDAAVSDDGIIYAVWRLVRAGSRSKDGGVFSATFDSDGKRTSNVTRAPVDSGALELVLLAGQLHLISGPVLSHHVKGITGRDDSWTELPGLGNGRASSSFDAIATPVGIVVASFARAAAGRPRELRLVRWASQDLPVTTTSFSFPASTFSPAPPRLAFDGRTVHVVVGANQEGTSPSASVEGRVFYAASQDFGSSWSKPTDVTAAAYGLAAGSPSPLQTIGGVGVLGFADRIYAFFHQDRLWVTVSTDGVHWQPPTTVDSFEPGFGATYVTESVGAASVATRAEVAWIDTRNRKSDRRWWNPLGGLPWSDSPDWQNNDVYVMDVARIGSSATRLTRDGSSARSLVIRRSATSLFGVWSGRAKVDRSGAGSPPSIFLTSIF